MPARDDANRPARPRRGERRLVTALGGPHDGNGVLVYGDPPLELEIDRCMYVLDEAGVPGHTGPVYVYVPSD
ncbi:MAG TPA: hypothetical protein VHI95_14345 [Acidimicrobiales bacterium]|nr:hypothetical protein [Acidimicrobiales bacterium]